VGELLGISNRWQQQYAKEISGLVYKMEVAKSSVLPIGFD